MDIEKMIDDEWAVISGAHSPAESAEHMKAVTYAWYKKSVLNVLAAEHAALDEAVKAEQSVKKIPEIIRARFDEIKAKLGHALNELPAVFHKNR